MSLIEVSVFEKLCVVAHLFYGLPSHRDGHDPLCEGLVVDVLDSLAQRGPSGTYECVEGLGQGSFSRVPTSGRVFNTELHSATHLPAPQFTSRLNLRLNGASTVAVPLENNDSLLTKVRFVTFLDPGLETLWQRNREPQVANRFAPAHSGLP